MPSAVNVMIVDDHPVLREELCRVIDEEADLAVLGEAGDEDRILRALLRREPDVLVFDIALREGSLSFEFLHAVRSRFPRIHVLIYSAHDELIYGERCLRGGAVGYVSKEAGPRLLLQAVRAAAAGERFVSPELSRRLMERFFDDRDSAERLNRLSDRELEVFYMIGRSFSAKEIANRLGITRNTVESHFQRVRRKMSFEDNAHLVREAQQWYLGQATAERETAE